MLPTLSTFRAGANATPLLLFFNQRRKTRQLRPGTVLVNEGRSWVRAMMMETAMPFDGERMLHGGFAVDA